MNRTGEVTVFAADEQSDEPVDTNRWVGLARQVLAAEGVKPGVELSMLFVDEVAMAELNSRFLGRTGPTDVLAFPIDDDVYEGGRNPDSPGPGSRPEPEWADAPVLLGDVVVCPAVARRNAPAHGRGYEEEMALLVVHGILHLFGMDHEAPAEAQAMQRRERELLERFYER